MKERRKKESGGGLFVRGEGKGKREGRKGRKKGTKEAGAAVVCVRG